MKKNSIMSAKVIVTALLIAGCTQNFLKGEPRYPKSKEEMTREKYGTVSGDAKGFVLFGGKKTTQADEQTGLGVNAYLWKASLDTISFMPLASVDPFGGVILTDWYTAPEAMDERFKVNIFIVDKQLRSDAVRVTLFKQRRAQDGWADAQAGGSAARQMEDAILTRARQLRVQAQQ